MNEKTPSPQPCNPRGLDEVLSALRDYAARVKPRAARRLSEIQTLLNRLEQERDGEKKELDALVSSYFAGEGTAPERLDRCIAVLEEMLRNPALPKEVFDASQCVHGSGPCPPQTEPETEQTGSQSAVPSDRDGQRRYRWRGYYDAHRTEILADLKALGYNRTLAKWDLTSATLVTLRRRWGETPPKGKGGGQGG